jgi:hypothetical protein
MANYVTERATEIARLMGGEIVAIGDRSTPYSIVPYQTTHNTGGAIMGADPKTSVVNRYLQSWDATREVGIRRMSNGQARACYQATCVRSCAVPMGGVRRGRRSPKMKVPMAASRRRGASY